MDGTTADTVPSTALNRRASLPSRLARHWQLSLMLIPGLFVMVSFFYLPMFGAIIAFQKYDIVRGFFGSAFVGLQNFANLFADNMIFIATRNTLAISLLKLLFAFPMPILFALLLNEVRRSGFKRSVQTISYLPHFVSWVVVIGIWSRLLAVEGGIINDFIARLGGERINFMVTKEFMWPLAVIMNIWKETGWVAIIYLASLSAIDPQQYEAARIDGANGFQQAVYITLPGIRSTIVIMLIMTIPQVFNGNLDQMWAMGNLATRDVTEIIDTYVLRTGIGNAQYSVAAAAGLAKSAVSIVLLVIVNSIAKALGEEGLY